MQYTALGVVGLIVLCCTVCICKCCCCKKKSSSSKKELSKFNSKLDDDSDTAPLIRNSNSKTAKRREEMRQKWGIGDAEEV